MDVGQLRLYVLFDVTLKKRKNHAARDRISFLHERCEEISRFRQIGVGFGQNA